MYRDQRTGLILPMSCAFSLVAHTIAGDSNEALDITTSGINTTGADLLVVSIHFYQGSGADPTPSDSKGNTWSARTKYDSSNRHVRIYYSQGGSVGSGHTFTLAQTAPSQYLVIAVTAWSGSAASPYDVESGANTGSGASLATGSVTPTQANELVISAITSSSATAHTINASMTVSDDLPQNSGPTTHVGGAMAYIVQTSASAINPTWSFASGSEAAAAIATFKAAAGGASGGGPLITPGELMGGALVAGRLAN
jgi:hypothetical protein